MFAISKSANTIDPCINISANSISISPQSGHSKIFPLKYISKAVSTATTCDAMTTYKEARTRNAPGLKSVSQIFVSSVIITTKI